MQEGYTKTEVAGQVEAMQAAGVLWVRVGLMLEF